MHGVFLVTDFFGGAKGDADTEVLHGKNAVDAAKEVQLNALIKRDVCELCLSFMAFVSPACFHVCARNCVCTPLP